MVDGRYLLQVSCRRKARIVTVYQQVIIQNVLVVTFSIGYDEARCSRVGLITFIS